MEAGFGSYRSFQPDYSRYNEFDAVGARALIEQILDNPELDQYVHIDNVQRAAWAFAKFQRVIAENPFLLDVLDQAASHTKKIALLIIPGFNMVVTKVKDRYIAMSPLLTCSLQAMDDIAGSMEEGEQYTVVHTSVSMGEIINFVWQEAEEDPRAVVSYRGSGIDPVNYLAMGTLGFFRNEIYRMQMPEK